MALGERISANPRLPWLLLLLLVGGIGRGTESVDGFLFGDGDEVVESEPVAEQESEPVIEEEAAVPVSSSGRRILVFGGNGFIGAETVDRLIQAGDSVTIVNRGNWYWDSKDRIGPRVNAISCDRQNGVRSCEDLVKLVAQVDKFDAVVDFSAYGPREITDAVALLGGTSDKPKAAVYILISTDSVYDVCDPEHQSPTGQVIETHAIRPTDPEVLRMLAEHHVYGNGKLEAEEELVKQRKLSPSNETVESPTGIPYVMLRLPDVLGPRDTTYRFWVYQLWIRVAAILPIRPVVVPEFLLGYNNSFVYVEDVARTVVDVVDRVASSSGSVESLSPILDQPFNLAWPQNITLDGMLRDIESALRGDKDDSDRLTFKSEGDENLYLYPTVRRGPIDSSKAAAAFGWRPTDWRTAIRKTVEFYEAAMKSSKWEKQRDEIIQIVSSQLYSDSAESRQEFYSAVEKLYGIDLDHFRPKKEEL